MKITANLLITLGLIGSMVEALPIHHEHGNAHEKREIVTRMHTAATQTVTDFYSTTTNVVVAPTVEFIVSGDATYTTTLSPDGVIATAQPITLTTTLELKQAAVAASDNANVDQATGAAATTNDAVASTYSPQQPSTTSQTTLLPSSSAGTEQNQEAESTFIPSQAGATTTSLTGARVSAIGNNEVAASTVTPPPAQVHSSATAPSSLGNVDATTTSTPSPASSSSGISLTTGAAATSSAVVNSGSVPVALTYSPYNSDGSCRSSDSIYNDLAIIKSKGVTQVRIYGTDCGSLATVQPACAKLGLKINQGLWIDGSGVDSIDSGIASLIQYGQTNGWDIFEYITIGNEAINSGFCSVSDLISKIQSVKSQLKSAGYNGQVTTSEPPVSFLNNPELCTQSGIDFVGVNPHSYFNADIDASEAGAFIASQVALTKSACGTENVVVTETGYPSSGNVNGKNVPSVENQQIAIASILETMNQEVTILSYFDDLWKAPGPYGIEQSFGIQSFMP